MSVVGRKPRVRPRPPAPRRLEDRASRVDAAQLEAQLRAEVRGEVLFDAGWRSVYTHDSGNYRHIPLGAVAPVDRDDVAAAVAVCRRLGAPVVPRGCGTSIPGTVLASDAVVIDVSKHMREIVEIDAERRFARVRPGLIRDDLTRRTEERHRLTFAPDTSTHEYATFGGMIGSNSCGVHSVMGGRTSDNVEELEVLTYDGLRMRVGATSEEELEEIIAEGGRRGEIYRGMRDLRDRYADLIRERYPDIPRRVSGYNLDDLLPENGFHVARAITGSEGTLATVLEAKVRLLPSPPERALVALGFPDVYIAGDHVAAIRERGPIALEGMDRRLITDMELRGMHPHDIPLLPEGDGWLLVEFGGDTRDEALERAGEFTRWLEELDEPPAIKLVDDVGEERRLWKVREDALAATAYRLGERDHWEGWEDAAVPPERLGDYLRDFHELLDRYDYRTTLYGHFGDGCVHCRIDFDPLSVGGLRRWRSFLDEASDLIVHYGGSFSGEHGDGQARSELLPKLYGDELMEAFRQFKSIWDPDWKMNPGKVVQPDGIMSDLKLGVEYNPPQPKTYFAYPEDGGSFAHAAARCVGAGKCRDVESGTMCPSYMVTLDEKHTTRGRARILFEMLQGQTIRDGFRSQEVNEALELCLSCKGCKGDCPVNVDMATYKAEFLSRHYKRRLRPAAAYSMGLIMLHARVAQHAPRLANALPRVPVIGGALKRAAGISAQRELPRFARQTFRTWFDTRDPVNQGAPAVVLFPDTFTNFLHPDPGKATVEVLEAAGYRVVVPQAPMCCGRPLYDYGMLPTARRFLRHLVRVLRPHIRAGVYVVGIEPSCVAVFRDELVNMLPHDEDAKRLSLQTLTLAEFLEAHARDWDMPKLSRRAIVHGHCHHKAVMGMSAEEATLERLGLDFELLDSGCCGVAGSFGYEADHYDLSVKIGERRLLPAVRSAEPDTLVISDGFSCHTQITQLTDRRPLHLAEVIRMALDGDDGHSGR
ncbi:MAG TPA: FAD-linked oxidase C-terminal domain-containing protein [Solirubrobacteraceae bacterium]|nr:FAD-linked oxidase C-terminal domain-containing protein [Solirubrobacteraceae bacterium]